MALSVSGGRALPFLIVCESVQIILHTFNSAVSPPSGPRLIGVKKARRLHFSHVRDFKGGEAPEAADGRRSQPLSFG